MPKEYPRGKLRADDEGATSIMLAVKDGTTLIIAFPDPTLWIGLGIVEAEALIAGMQEKVALMKTGAA